MERQFSKNKRAIHRICRNRADRHKEPKRDGKVEMRTLLDHVGRRKVDGNPLGRQGQPDRGERRTDPFARLRHCLVGKADNGHGRKAVGNMNLNFNRNGIDAAKRHRFDAGMHGAHPVFLDHP